MTLVRTDEPVNALLRGDVDVAVLRDPRNVAEGVRVVPLFEEQRVVICSVHAGISSGRPVTRADFGNHPFVYNAVSGTVGPRS